MTLSCESQFKLTILSASKTLLDQHVVFAIIPACEGDFGVLPHHAPFVANLKAGQIKVYREDKHIITETIETTGGVVTIKNNTCELLLTE